MNSHVILYAVWSSIPLPLVQEAEPEPASDRRFTVTYNANGGTGSVPTDSTVYNSGDTVSVQRSPEPTRKGFSFVGWTQSRSATRAIVSFTITADTTLYALWQTETTGTIVTSPEPAAAVLGFADALSEQSIPVVDLFGAQLPLAAPSGFGAWSLFDLIATLAAVLSALIAVIRLLVVRNREKVDEDVYATKRGSIRVPALALGIACAAVTLLLFAITQNTALPVVLFDLWSVLFGAALVASVLAAALCVKHSEDNKQERPQAYLGTV
jgi:uncharacterized repeat protein (TIGR02543 family)